MTRSDFPFSPPCLFLIAKGRLASAKRESDPCGRTFDLCQNSQDVTSSLDCHRSSPNWPQFPHYTPSTRFPQAERSSPIDIRLLFAVHSSERIGDRRFRNCPAPEESD